MSVSKSNIPTWGSLIWGLLFGGLNLAWSLGSRLLVDHLAVSIQDDVAKGEQSLMIMNTIGGLGKIALGLLAFATITRLRPHLPHGLVTWTLLISGTLMAMYGTINWMQMLQMEVGFTDVSESIGTENVRWYLLLWEPLWIIGGLMLFWAGQVFRRR